MNSLKRMALEAAERDVFMTFVHGALSFCSSACFVAERHENIFERRPDPWMSVTDPDARAILLRSRSGMTLSSTSSASIGRKQWRCAHRELRIACKRRRDMIASHIEPPRARAD